MARRALFNADEEDARQQAISNLRQLAEVVSRQVLQHGLAAGLPNLRQISQKLFRDALTVSRLPGSAMSADRGRAEVRGALSK
jgi:hypothetical protein